MQVYANNIFFYSQVAINYLLSHIRPFFFLICNYVYPKYWQCYKKDDNQRNQIILYMKTIVEELEFQIKRKIRRKKIYYDLQPNKWNVKEYYQSYLRKK